MPKSKLTVAQRAALNMLKEGPVYASSLHGNRIMVFQALRQMRLASFDDGVFKLVLPLSKDQEDTIITESHGKLTLKKLAEKLGVHTDYIVNARKRLGLPRLVRGRPSKKPASPAVECLQKDNTPGRKALPAQYSNPSWEDHIKRIENVRI